MGSTPPQASQGTCAQVSKHFCPIGGQNLTRPRQSLTCNLVRLIKISTATLQQAWRCRDILPLLPEAAGDVRLLEIDATMDCGKFRRSPSTKSLSLPLPKSQREFRSRLVRGAPQSVQFSSSLVSRSRDLPWGRRSICLCRTSLLSHQRIQTRLRMNQGIPVLCSAMNGLHLGTRELPGPFALPAKHRLEAHVQIASNLFDID